LGLLNIINLCNYGQVELACYKDETENLLLINFMEK